MSMMVSQSSPKGALMVPPKRRKQETAQGNVVDDDFSGFFPRFGGEDGGFPGFGCIRKRSAQNVRKPGSTLSLFLIE
jgi:hypothetical protein